MTTRLVNVRLDEERTRKARALRASGIAVSDLLREAIDRRYEQVVRSPKGLDVAAIMRRIFEEHPDPPNLAPRRYDVHDRAAAGRLGDTAGDTDLTRSAFQGLAARTVPAGGGAATPRRRGCRR
jgi:hypothetical protein